MSSKHFPRVAIHQLCQWLLVWCLPASSSVQVPPFQFSVWICFFWGTLWACVRDWGHVAPLSVSEGKFLESETNPILSQWKSQSVNERASVGEFVSPSCSLLSFLPFSLLLFSFFPFSFLFLYPPKLFPRAILVFFTLPMLCFSIKSKIETVPTL